MVLRFMEKIKFLIVIPTFNQEILLERTLNSLLNCLVPEGLLKIIIIENGPKGNVENMLDRYETITKIKTEYRYEGLANKSNALNVVLGDITESFILFLDDDIRLGETALAEYYLAFKRFGIGHFFGGQVSSDFDEPKPPSHLIDFYPDSVKGLNLGDKIIEIDKPIFLGCNWACYSEDLKGIGGFDCNFGPGADTGSVGQETTAMEKLLKLGIKAIYLPDAKVWHFVPNERSDFEWLKNRKYRIGIRAGLLTKKKTNLYKTYFGVPLWFYRSYLISFFNFKFKRHLIKDKKIEAGYILEYYHNRGMLKGFFTRV